MNISLNILKRYQLNHIYKPNYFSSFYYFNKIYFSNATNTIIKKKNDTNSKNIQERLKYATPWKKANILIDYIHKQELNKVKEYRSNINSEYKLKQKELNNETEKNSKKKNKNKLQQQNKENKQKLRIFQQCRPGDAVEIEYIASHTENIVMKKPPLRFRGVILRIKNQGIGSSILVRNVFEGGMAAEINFDVFSPLILSIKVLKRAFIHNGKKRVKRSKLYYLRDKKASLTSVPLHSNFY